MRLDAEGWRGLFWHLFFGKVSQCYSTRHAFEEPAHGLLVMGIGCDWLGIGTCGKIFGTLLVRADVPLLNGVMFGC